MKYVLLILLMISNVITAQVLEWGTTIGGTDSDHARKVKTDSDGNVYVTGYFTGTTDFDPSSNTFELTSVGTEDIFVLKLDSNGNFLWAKSMGGTQNDEAFSLNIDAFGDLLIVGYFEGIADFDPGVTEFNLTSDGDKDVFIVKLSSNGNLLWASAIGGNLWDAARGIVSDGAGNVLISGNFQGTADFDPSNGIFNVTSNSIGDSFILKLDVAGNFDWVKILAGNDQDSSVYTQSISVNSNNEIIISGIFQGIMDINPGAMEDLRISNGHFDCFVVQLDADGNLEWGNIHGNDGPSDGVYAAKPDTQGNIYVTGHFEGTVDFDPGPGEFFLTPMNGSNNVYLQKLDSDGNLIWAQIIGESPDFAFARAYDMTIDENDSPIVLVKFDGTLDFDSGPNEKTFTSLGGYDAALVKLYPSGEFKWAGHMGGTGSILGLGIHSDKNGNLYTTGYFLESIDLDPNEGTLVRNSNGFKDLFITKLRNPSLSVENPILTTGFVAYPNPTSGRISLSSGQLVDHVTLNLYSVSGQLVKSLSKASVKEFDVFLTGASGVYILEIITNTGIETFRIIKN